MRACEPWQGRGVSSPREYKVEEGPVTDDDEDDGDGDDEKV